MPVPAVVEAAHAVGRPGHDMRDARCDLLLAAGATERLRRARAADPADEPLTVTVRLTAGSPPDGTLQVKCCALGTSSMLSGHSPSVSAAVAVARAPGQVRRRCGIRALPYDPGNGR